MQDKSSFKKVKIKSFGGPYNREALSFRCRVVLFRLDEGSGQIFNRLELTLLNHLMKRAAESVNIWVCVY